MLIKKQIVFYVALAALSAGDASLSLAQQRRDVPGGGPVGGNRGGGEDRGSRPQPQQPMPQQPRQDYPQQPRQEQPRPMPQQPRQDYPQQPRQDYPQQPRPMPQQPRQDYPQQPRQDYPQQPRQNYPQQPGNYPQQPRQDWPQRQPQQPQYPQQQPGNYPRQPGNYPQQPGNYPQLPRRDVPGGGPVFDHRWDNRFPQQGPGRDWDNERRERPDRRVDRDDYRNVVTRTYYDRCEDTRRREDMYRRDPRVSIYVNQYNDYYSRTYRPTYYVRQQSCSSVWSTNHTYYNNWRSYGFCGGYHWQFRPIVDVSAHFYNPLVTWFYVSTWDDDYYRPWYGNDYVNYPQLHVVNDRAGVFFPTEEFMELNTYVAGLSVLQQINYRTAMNSMVSRLESVFSYGSYVRFGQGEVVINHFQALPYENAFVIEGFAANTAYQAPFKAIIDLDTPNDPIVFIPNGQGAPSSQQISELQQMNNLIVRMGGVVEYGEDDGFDVNAGVQVNRPGSYPY